MYNIILTNNKNEQFYVSSNLDVEPFYNDNEKLIFEFEDYEDANNVVIDFISKYPNEYRDNLFEIEVEQI